MKEIRREEKRREEKKMSYSQLVHFTLHDDDT
jgi:hypothetical protein